MKTWLTDLPDPNRYLFAPRSARVLATGRLDDQPGSGAFAQRRPERGREVKDCIRCHTPLPVDGRFCSNCGTPTEELSHVCPADPTDELKERLARTLAGRYEIIRLLGRGGMAVVFLAQTCGSETKSRSSAPARKSTTEAHSPVSAGDRNAPAGHPNFRLPGRSEADSILRMKYVTGPRSIRFWRRTI